MEQIKTTDDTLKISKKKKWDCTIPENMIFDIKKNNIKYEVNNNPIEKLNLLKPYEYWKHIGSPKYVCAPMVDQSDIAFRILTRNYNTQYAYTPMFHSVVAVNCLKSRSEWIGDVNPLLDSPTAVQLCGHDPEYLLKAARIFEGKCQAIDINFGCPQGIAKRGNYGAYLLDDTDLVLKIVGYLANNLKDSALTCKIRVFPDLEKTYSLVQEMEKKGAKVIAVHGRTKEEKGRYTRECKFEAIKKIKQLVSVPVISNGGIETYEDVEECFKYTGVDAVMSSEGLLEYPALFSNKKVESKIVKTFDDTQKEIICKDDIVNIDDLALEYLDIAKKVNTRSNYVRTHMFKFFYQACQDFPELNSLLGQSRGFDQFYEFVNKVKELRKNMLNASKIGWYRRYRKEKFIYDVDETTNSLIYKTIEKEIPDEEIENKEDFNRKFKNTKENNTDNTLINLDEGLMEDVGLMYLDK